MIPNGAKDARWWNQPENKHETVFEACKRITNRTSEQRIENVYNLALFGDSTVLGLGGTYFDSVVYEPERMALNIVRQCVQTLAAKIGQAQPLPKPVTTDGSYRQRRRAKKLGDLFEGVFEAACVWNTSPSIARDAGLFGTGLTHNYRVGRKLYHERVFPWEIRVDPRDAHRGAPRTLYKVSYVDRYVLMDRFPEHEEAIVASELDTWDDVSFSNTEDSDLLLVIEAWHLPSGEEASDGRHTICLNNVCLLDEEWTKHYFPFTVLRIEQPTIGWFGTGIAKTLTGLQYTINAMAESVQESALMSGGYVTIERGSGVEVDKLNNGSGNVLYYTGQKPEWIYPSPFNPLSWQFMRELVPMAFEVSAVSQLSAQSRLPAGIESSVAQQTFSDFESERFAVFSKGYEQYHIDLAWQFFDLLEEIQEEYGDLKVKTAAKARGQRVLKDIDYEAVRMDREEFVLKVYPSNLLAKKPAARLQQIEQYVNIGWVSPEDAKILMEMPDLDAFVSLSTATTRYVENAIQKILDSDSPEEDYEPPDGVIDLKLAVAKGTLMLVEAMTDGADEENLELVRQWLVDCKELIDRAKPPAEMAPPGAPGMDGSLPPGAMPPDAMPPEMMPPEMLEPLAAPGMGPPMPDGPVPPDMPPPPPAMPN